MTGKVSASQIVFLKQKGEIMSAKGKITVNKELCKGCGVCISVCPVKILDFDNSDVNSKGYHPMKSMDPDKCIACANCGLMCPDAAITVERF